MDTNKSDSSSKKWIEVASSCINIGLCSNPISSFGQATVENSFSYHYRNWWSSKNQTKQHQKGNCFLCRFNIWHTQTLVIAVKSRVNWLEDISKFKKIKANNRRCQYWQLYEVEAGQEGDAVLGHFALRTLLGGHAGGRCGRPRGSAPRPLAAGRWQPPAAVSSARHRQRVPAPGWRQELRGPGCLTASLRGLRAAASEGKPPPEPGELWLQPAGERQMGGAGLRHLRGIPAGVGVHWADPGWNWSFGLVSGKPFSERAVGWSREQRFYTASVLVWMCSAWVQLTDGISPGPLARQGTWGWDWGQNRVCGFSTVWNMWCNSRCSLKRNGINLNNCFHREVWYFEILSMDQSLQPSFRWTSVDVNERYPGYGLQTSVNEVALSFHYSTLMMCPELVFYL